MDNSINKEHFSNIDIGHPKILILMTICQLGKWHYIFKTIEEVMEEVLRDVAIQKTGFDAGHILQTTLRVLF